MKREGYASRVDADQLETVLGIYLRRILYRVTLDAVVAAAWSLDRGVTAASEIPLEAKNFVCKGRGANSTRETSKTKKRRAKKGTRPRS